MLYSHFITEDFLLQSPLARQLYRDYVQGLPIVDYHNHLSASDLAADRKWADIGELWVAGDPYKHRAMRLCGVEERCISGPASTREKFDAWCRIFHKTAGGPLFHWSLLELRNIFGIEELPSAQTAQSIWDRCNRLLQTPDFSTLAIMRKWNCKRLTTSDDIVDNISVHRAATAVAGDIEITPSLRADSTLAFQSPAFDKLLDKLSATRAIRTLEDYLAAIDERLDAFDHSACRLADHALDNGWRFSLCEAPKAAQHFAKVLCGQSLSAEEAVELKSFVLFHLAQQYARRGWIMQLHIGAERFTSSRLRSLAGAAGGYASLGHSCDIRSLCSLLDKLDQCGQLPKTLLYTLNPADNAALAVLTGSFSQDGVSAKLIFGPAWWYNDHKMGMEEQLRTLASYSLLPTFIGMTTDSRNILSFSRHDYFRRILCNMLADLALKGELPSQADFLGPIAADIAYHNAEQWVYQNK